MLIIEIAIFCWW